MNGLILPGRAILTQGMQQCKDFIVSKVGSEQESDEVPDWRAFENFDLAGDVGGSVGPTWQIYVLSKGLPKLVNFSAEPCFPCRRMNLGSLGIA